MNWNCNVSVLSYRSNLLLLLFAVSLSSITVRFIGLDSNVDPKSDKLLMILILMTILCSSFCVSKERVILLV